MTACTVLPLYCCLALLCAIASADGAARAAEFTAAQRAEIVAVVRDALKRDPSILRDAVVALQADDGKKSRLPPARLSPTRGRVGHLSRPGGRGPAMAIVTIVEFFDTRCPYCRRMEPVMAQFRRPGPARCGWSTRTCRSWDQPASGQQALLAAQQQDAYEKMRDAVMTCRPIRLCRSSSHRRIR